MKVVELVEARQAYGWSPEELSFEFPHLGLAKIHAALAYYWDHQSELDAEIEGRIAYGEEARLTDGPSPLAEKLRAARLMKDEYDFSQGERGKFYSPDAKFEIPVE